MKAKVINDALERTMALSDRTPAHLRRRHAAKSGSALIRLDA
jgi:hypothetical protein